MAQEGKSAPGAKFGSDEVIRDFLLAYSSYLKALSSANISDEVRRQLAEAQQGLNQSLCEATASSDYQKFHVAYVTYWKKVQDLGHLSDTRAAWDQAYRAFLKASREAWGKLDIDVIDPVRLAVIGNALTAAAFLNASRPTVES